MEVGKPRRAELANTLAHSMRSRERSTGNLFPEPATILDKKTAQPLLLLALAAVLLLAANGYWLWKPRADQASGDTLIHLIFARNGALGHPFEFNPGFPSRAMTAPLWNWLLVAGGVITGTTQDTEGFLLVFRLLSVATLVLALWLAWRLCRKLGGDRLWAMGGVVLLLTNPSTFYWTVANPMETAGAALVTLGLVGWVLAVARRPTSLLWAAGGLLTAAGFLVRPELLIFGGLAAGAAFLCSHPKPWRGAVAYGAGAGVILAGWALSLKWSGLAVMPNAGSARRLMLLLDDAADLPLLHIPYSPDAALFLTLFLPVFLGVLIELWNRPGRAAALAVVFITGFTLLFFTLYFYTTWQGRYLLPALFVIVPVGMAGWSKVSIFGRWTTSAGLVLYSVILAVLLLRPLSAYADAPRQRAAGKPAFIAPPPEARSILVQEIQSAWFHPQLFHICSEGLIGLESLEARKRDITVLEFIREQKPDLIGAGRYPLRDPEGVARAVGAAAREKRNLSLPGLELTYLGEMPGCGAVFQAHWTSP